MAKSLLKELKPGHRQAFFLLTIAVFVLFAFPRARLIPSLPFYLIDFFLLAAYLRSRGIKGGLKIKEGGVIFILIISGILSELHGLFLYGYPLESIYMLVRFFAGTSVIFTVAKSVTSVKLYLQIIRVASAGALISALIMIFASLPFTRGIVTALAFSNPFLAPPDDLFEGVEGATRGRSLIGTSNLTSAFINTLLPYAFLGRLYLKRFNRKKNLWLTIFLVVGPMGIFLGYSRGGLLGLIVVLLGFLVLGSSQLRRILIPLTLFLGLFLAYAWNNDEYFMFDRIEKRTLAAFNDPEQAKSETERIYSFTEPFEYLAEHPAFLLFGEGGAAYRLGRRGAGLERIYNERAAATHSVFAKGFYTYGMFYALFVFGLVFTLIFRNLALARKAKDKFSKLSLNTSVVSLTALLPWMLTAHGMVTNPRGFFLYLFIISLAYASAFVPKFYRIYVYQQKQKQEALIRAA